MPLAVFTSLTILRPGFELLAVRGAITDDSIMTLATADWLLKGGEPGKFYVRYANENPRPLGGYGTMFAHWLREVEVTGKIVTIQQLW